MKKLVLILLVITTFVVIELRAQTTGTFTDARDGKIYKTVKIGTQTWMAENLNYATSNGSWCFKGNIDSCKKYGRLYDWEIAKIACPSGWHLPSDNEWQTLIDYLGGNDIAGGKLKSTSGWWKHNRQDIVEVEGGKLISTSEWSPNTGTTNSSGFSALPGGYRQIGMGLIIYVPGDSQWWTATDADTGSNSIFAWYRLMIFDSSGVKNIFMEKENGVSVRCLKD